MRRSAFRLSLAAVFTFCSFSAVTFAETGGAAAPQAGELEGLLASLTAEASSAAQLAMTPLHAAARRADAGAVAALLAGGADANARTVDGRTPLFSAISSGDIASLQTLLAAGADPNAADKRGETPLHLAARLLKAEAIAALLAAGADPSAANSAGRTPLHVLGSSARERDEATHALAAELAVLLIAHGADPAIIAGGLPAFIEPPIDPADLDGYSTHAQIAQRLQNAAAAYPAICEWYSIGLSGQGRELWAVKISDNVGIQEDEPEFKYIGGIHGDEILGTEMCLRLIDHMLATYGTDPRITQLVDEVEIWIVPLMNPDGYERSPRTRVNASGIDLNRNFPDPYTSPTNTPAGRAAEVGVIMEWSFGQSFTLSANLHGGALVVNYPFDNNPGGQSVFTPTPDEDLFVYISEEYSRHNLPMWNSSAFTHGITNGAAWYAISGGMQDWNYHYMGCNEVTLEIGVIKQPSYSQVPQFWEENRESMLSYMDTCLLGVRGVVTDFFSGEPVAATIEVVDRDHEIYADPDVGDYHRMLLPGPYTLLFTAPGYDGVIEPDIFVQPGAATRVDVRLTPQARLIYPNGGETLPWGEPIDVTWAGERTYQFEVQYTPNHDEHVITTDGFERTQLGTEYSTGGDASWATTTQAAYAGQRSAGSGVIGNNQRTWLRRTLEVENQAVISFIYTVSSEQGHDFFNFHVNGVQKIHASGTTPWRTYGEVLQPGTYELEWEYVKDALASRGADAAWFDELVIDEELTRWITIAPLTPVGAQAATWTPTVPSTRSKVRVRADMGGFYSIWDESAALFEVLPGPAAAGDLNCDGLLDNEDIDPFVLALTDRAAYAATWPNCNVLLADITGDGLVDNEDIDPFVALLTGE